MRSTKSKGSWEMLNKEQPKQGWQISHQEQVKEEESGQWLSENERKINLTSQSYVWQKYYSQLNIKQRCFQTWKHLWPICPNTRTVKECPEAKKKKKVKPDGRPTLGKRRRTTEWQSQEYMHALLLIIWLFSKDVISQSNVIVFLNMYVSKMCAVCFVYYILTNLFKNKTIKITTKLKCNNGCIRIGRLKG